MNDERFAPDIAADIVEHMNDDHADAVLAIARVQGGAAGATAATLVSITPHALDFDVVEPAGTRTVRAVVDPLIAPFDTVRARLIAMTHAARGGRWKMTRREWHRRRALPSWSSSSRVGNKNQPFTLATAKPREIVKRSIELRSRFSVLPAHERGPVPPCVMQSASDTSITPFHTIGGWLWLVLALVGTAVPTAVAVEIPDRYGVARIDAAPRRIVSLSLNGADFLLSLGIQPVGYRAWYGGDDAGLWPWSAPLLDDDADPYVLRGEIDIERVALLKPDLIEALRSGISRAQYRALSRIAPVLGPPPGSGDFDVGWREMTQVLGRAAGLSERGDALIDNLDERFARVRAAHPEWERRTAVIAWPARRPLVYSEDDVRGQLLSLLGFRSPDALKRLAGPAFFVPLDVELTEPIDADLLLWLDVGFGVEAVRAMPLRATLRAVAEGREVVADPILAAALSYASPPSLAWALERLVPLIELAVDGDPATRVPATHRVNALE